MKTAGKKALLIILLNSRMSFDQIKPVAVIHLSIRLDCIDTGAYDALKNLLFLNQHG